MSERVHRTTLRAFERQPGESQKAFAAWQVYRDWGPDRSYSKVAQQLSKSASLIKRWAKQNEWLDRLQAFEDWKQMIRMDALEEEERKRVQDMAERERRLDERILALKERIIVKMEEMVQFPLAVEKVERKGEKGEEEVVHIHPARWSFNTVVNLLSVLDKTTKRIDLTKADEPMTFTLWLGEHEPHVEEGEEE